MKYLGLPLAVAGLTVWSAAAGWAQDASSHQSATLYTGSLAGTTFVCKAVNVSDKTLHIGFALLDDMGNPLTDTTNPPAPNPAPSALVDPGTEAELSVILETADDGYCKVTVFGTGDRDRVRVVLEVQRTRTIPGTNPPIPVFVFKNTEGH